MSARALCLLFAGVLVATWASADRLEDTFYVPLDDPHIRYAQEALNDSVARLEKRMENGQAKLEYARTEGYVASILKALDIHPDSQVLVFSKSSIQNSHISPRTPRAIYFNDEVAVGFVQNGDEVDSAKTCGRK